MEPPQVKRMNMVQQAMVMTALQITLEKGIHFTSLDAIHEYLSASGVLPDPRGPFNGEIFDCYLGLQRATRATQVISPSLSDSQLNTSEASLDTEDRSEKNSASNPTFNSDVS